MGKRSDFFANNVPISTSFIGGVQFVPTCRLWCSGTSKKPRKIHLLAPHFVQYVFVNFSNILHQLAQNSKGVAIGHPQCRFNGLMEAPECTDTLLAQTVFLTLFHNLDKRVTTMNVTAVKKRQTCCPIGHSTATSPPLAMPVMYKAPSVLQF